MVYKQFTGVWKTFLVDYLADMTAWGKRFFVVYLAIANLNQSVEDVCMNV